MPSYTSPQVDHNLYAPVLPQTNVAEIFQLMGLKQQMYDSNLARINTQVSPMNDLDSSVSSGFVKDKVNEFNKKANEKLKGYTNLDFSIRDNVNTINNMYDPLMKDQDFLIDYSATSHGKSEIQKALSYRDSPDKDKRAGYSDGNLQYVANGANLLKTAKNTKDLKIAAAEAISRYYSPYTDVGDEVLKKIKEFGAEVSWDDVPNNYVVTRTGSAADPGFKKSIKDFLDLTLSDNAKNQIRINSTLKVDNLIQQKGLDQVALDYLKDIPTQVEHNRKIINDQLKDLDNKISIIPIENLRNDKHREDYKALLEAKDYYNKQNESNNEKEKAYNSLQEQLQNGTYNSNDIVHLLRSEVEESDIDDFTEQFSSVYSSSHSTVKVDASSYNTQKTVSLGYANLAQNQLEHRDTQNQLKITNALDAAKFEQENEKLNLEYAKAGLVRDVNGNLVPRGDKGVEDYTEAKGSIDDINKSINNFIVSKNKEHIEDLKDFSNLFKKKYNREPSSRDIYNFKNGKNLKSYYPEVGELYSTSSYNNNILKDEELFIKDNRDAAIKKFNEIKGYEAIKKDASGRIVKVEDIPWYRKMLLPSDLERSGYNSKEELQHIDYLNQQEFEEFLKRPNNEKGKYSYEGFGFGQNIQYETKDYKAGAEGNAFMKDKYSETLREVNNILELGSNAEGEFKKLNNTTENPSEILTKFNQLLSKGTVESGPSVHIGLEGKGTKISFPNLKIEDLYTKDENDKYPAGSEKVIEKLKNGISLAIKHNEYSKLDRTSSRVFAKETVNLKEFDLSTYMKDDKIYIYPTDNKTYTFDDKGAKVILGADGLYKVIPESKETILFVYEPEAKQLHSTINSFYFNVLEPRKRYETNEFRVNSSPEISKYITNSKIKMNSDGSFYIPVDLLNKF